MKKILSYIIIALFPLCAICQTTPNCGTSVLNNGDFESGVMPDSRGQIDYSSGWSAATGDPDIFDEDLACFPACNNPSDFLCVDVPCNHFGFEEQNQGGKRYMGLWSAVHFAEDANFDFNHTPLSSQAEFVLVEASQIKLNETVTPCKKYELSFFVSSAEKGEVNEFLTADCGSFRVKLAKQAQSQLGYQPTDGQVIYSGQTCEKQGWEKFSFTFTPDSSYDYLIIESDLRSTYAAIKARVNGPNADVYSGFNILNNDAVSASLSNTSVNVDEYHDYNNGYWANSYIYIDDVVVNFLECETEPPVANAGPNKIICEGNSTQIGGNPTGFDNCNATLSYVWKDQSGTTVSTQPNPTVSPSQSTNYTVSVTNTLTNLFDTDQVSVGVIKANFPPLAPLVRCNLNSFYLNHPSTSGLTGYSYTWTNQNSPFDSYNAENIKVKPANNTSYKLTATHLATGCKTTYVQELEYYPAATVSVTGKDKICDGQSSFLYADVDGGKPGYQYSWYNETTPLGNSATIEVNPSATTSYTVIVTDNTGCQVSATKEVKVMEAFAGGPYYVCESGSITLGDNPIVVNATSPITYSWTEVNGPFSSNLTKPTLTVNSSRKFNLEITDGSGCKAYSSATVLKSGPIDLKIRPNSPVCINNSFPVAFNMAENNGQGPFTYDWSSSSSANLLNDPNLRIPTATYTNVGTESFTVNITDAANCTAQKTFNVSVKSACGGGSNPGGTGGGTGITTVYKSCITPGTNQIGPDNNPPSSDSYSYTWDYEPELSSTTVRQPTVASLLYKKTFFLEIKDLFSPFKSYYYAYQVSPNNLKVDAGRDLNVCLGEEVQIGTSPVAYDGKPSFAYSWKALGGFISTEETPVISPTTTLEYTVTATDYYNCKASDKVVVTVLSPPSVNLGLDQVYCSGLPANGIYLGSPTAVLGGSGNYDLTWIPDNWIDIQDQNSMEAHANPENTITYTLLAEDHNNGLRTCAASDEITIFIGDLDDADAGEDIDLCINDTITIGNNSFSSDFQYNWTPSTGLATPNMPNTEAFPDNTTYYTLTISDASGCLSTDYITINVNPLPLAEAGDTKYMCQGENAVIGGFPTGTLGTSPYAYLWTPNNELQNNTSSNPIASPDKDEHYFVTVTDVKGCEAEDSVNVWVTPRPDYIFNGGFEQGITPLLPGDIEKAAYWSKATGLPDYYDYKATCVLNCNPVDDLICFGVPCNHWGSQDHFDSQLGHYAGLLSLAGDDALEKLSTNPNLKGVQGVNISTKIATEAIETKMRTNMVVGEKYTICFKAANAKGGLIFGDLAPELFQKKGEVNIKLSQYSQDWQNLIPFSPVPIPEVASFTIEKTGVWDDYCFEYTAKDSFRYITLENGFPGVNLDISPGDVLKDILSSNVNNILNGNVQNYKNQLNPALISYVFIDEVSVLPECKIDMNTIVIRDTVEQCVVPCEVVVRGGGGTDNILGGKATGSIGGSKDIEGCPEGEIVYLQDGTDENGNPVMKEIHLVPVPAPIADAGNDIYLCNDECGVLGGNPSASGNSGDYQYEWTPGVGLSDPFAPNPTVCIDKDRVYYLEVTDMTTGCKAVDEVIVRINKGREFVRNGGFEDGIEPETIGQANAATGWFLATGDPDLFDLDLECLKWCTPSKVEPFCIDLPCNFAGYQELRHQGTDRYAGLMGLGSIQSSAKTATISIRDLPYFSNLPESDPIIGILNREVIQTINNSNGKSVDIDLKAHEAISSQLNEPMVIGQSYKVQLFGALAHKNLSSGLPANILGLVDMNILVKLSTHPINNELYEPTNAKLIYSKVLATIGQWEEVSLDFQADSAYKYIIIESHLSNNNIGSVVSFGNLDLALLEAYAYIDDISVSQSCGAANIFKKGASSLEDIQFEVYPNPADNVLNVSNNSEGDFGFGKLELVDLFGRVVFEDSINLVNSTTTFNLNQIPTGSYMVRLTYGENKVTTKKIVIVKK